MRAPARPRVGEELHDPESLSGLEIGRDRHPAEVAVALGRRCPSRAAPRSDGPSPRPSRACCCGWSGRARPAGRDRRTPRRRAATRVPRRHAGRRIARARARWPRAPTGRRRAPDAVERLDLVQDRRCGALDERDEPGRGDPHRSTRRRTPIGAAAEHAGSKVELALVREQLAVADVERLVVDEEADDLPVRDVHDRLARLRVAVAGLGVRERPQLVEGVQVGPGERRTAPPRRGSPRNPMWPFESANIDSACASTSRSSSVSRTDHGSTAKFGTRDHEARAAPRDRRRRRRRRASRSASACPTRSTPTTSLNRPARPAATPASASSNTAASSGRTSRHRAAARYMSGAGFPARCSRCGDDAVDADLEQIRDPGRLQHLAAVGACRDDGASQPASRAARTNRTDPAYASHAAAADQREHELVLPIAEPADGLGVGGSSRVPSGSSIPREERNDRTPSKRCLPSMYSS